MQPAKPRKFRILQTRNGFEHPHLVGIFQLRLETHHVVQRAQLVVLPELHHRIGLHLWLMRIGQPPRFHRAMAQRLRAAFRHHFNGQAAAEIGRGFFPFLEIGFFAFKQRLHEGFILRPSSGS